MKTNNSDTLIETLKRDFLSRQKRNSSYSLRAYSRFLGLDPSNLSKILKYQIKPGKTLRKKISVKLGIPFEVDLTKRKVNDQDYNELSLSSFQVISEWQHYAILEQIKLARHQKNFDKKLMARELGLSLDEFETSIGNLKRLELIEECEKSKGLSYIEKDTSSIVSMSSSEAHRKQQKQILEKAIDAMEETSIDLRSQSSMTVAISKNKISQASDMIKNFRRDLARFLSEDDGLDEVYNLSISLYPLTMNKNQENQL